VLAFAIGLIAVPLVRRGAIAVGMVDKPDGHRKIHRNVVAVGGGVGVLATALLALSIFALVSDTWGFRVNQRMGELVGLAIGSAFLCAVGLVDDKRGLAGKKKLLGQIIAASIIVGTGPLVEKISLFGFPISLGLLASPFAVVWILACINAINLIDGMDGLASSVGATIFASLAIIGLWKGNTESAVIALAMTGALLAFLVYNFYPASIFLGDTGSMLIGLISGTLLLRTTMLEGNVVPILIPMAVLTIPFFDTLAAVIRRKFARRSIFETDRLHIHHCFRETRPVRWSMSCIALLSLAAGLGAIASALSGFDGFALLSAGSVVAILAGTRSFGHTELYQLVKHGSEFFKGFVLPSVNENGRDFHIRLQGEANWEELWDELKAVAQRLGLARVLLDVNLPKEHEGFYAEWKGRPTDENAWRATVPLLDEGRPIGRLELAGDRRENADFQSWLGDVGELCQSVEARVAELAEEAHTVEPQPILLQINDAASAPSPKAPSKLAGGPVLPTGS
jgi:UDP-GlcNAc:undecaprenyl-phosphate GlcNAc-1-phosphate transferase